MSADKDRGIRREKQKRAKALRKQARVPQAPTDASTSKATKPQAG